MRNRQVPDPVQQRIYQSSWITVTLIVVTSLFLWSSLGLGRVSAWIPQVILTPTLVFLLLQLMKEFFDRKQAISATASPEKTGNASMLSALTWIGAMLLAVWISGLSLGSAFFCLAYLRWHAGERWQVSIAFALGLGFGLQLIFHALMQIKLYQGSC